MASLQQLLINLTLRGEKLEIASKLGRLARAVLTRRKSIDSFTEGMALQMMAHAAETATWLSPSDIASGASGGFDSCDLLCYLEIARLAGVPAIPATPILTISHDEIDAISPKIALNANPRAARVAKRISGLVPSPDLPAPTEPSVDVEAVDERLTAALDAVPEGWMVRNVRCGGSILKSLAGAGAAGPEAPQVRFGADLEVGPGWVRIGNRRRIDISDQRTLSAIASGPPDTTTFVARPWVPASRWRAGPDPHRHGTPFAGKGAWPCEWRAFIVNGVVTGVANYYGWLGEATPRDARIALDVRAAAQKMADIMKTAGLWPRSFDIESARHNPRIAVALEPFGREDVACTLDFIETAEGLLLLEGGPAHSPIGGGHCCAFAGTTGEPLIGTVSDTTGVAFRLLDGVLMADPETWANGLTASRDGVIVSFEQAEALAGDLGHADRS